MNTFVVFAKSNGCGGCSQDETKSNQSFSFAILDHHNFSIIVRSARGQIQSTNKKHLSYLSYTETIKTGTKLSAKANEEYKVKMKQQAKNKNKNKQE